MGYWMQQRDHNFVIRANNLHSAYKALRKWSSCPDNDSGQASLRERFVTLMRYNYYDVDFDNNTGDCTGIWFEGDRLGSSEEMFESIAPYVEHGSYVEYMGEDDYIWRWVFKQGELHEVSAKIVWEDDIL